MARSYSDLIEEMSDSVPTISRLLGEAHRHRCILATQCLEQPDLDLYLSGLEELLGYLPSLYTVMNSHQELRKVAFLVLRVRGDYEASVEAIFSGYHSIVSEKMRDVLEVELLLTDFSASPEHMEHWRTADQRILRTKFAPVHLRGREAKRRGVQPDQLPGAPDYRAHSQLLHVTPATHPLGGPGLNASASGEQLAFFLMMSFWEMYFHAHRFLLTCHALVEPYLADLPEQLVEELDYTERLDRFSDAWQMAEEEQDRFS